MLLKLTPELMNNGFVKLINKFYKSKIYIILIGVLVAMSAIFGLELFTYGFTLIMCALIPALFAEDMTSTVVPLMMYYCTFSFKHNNTLEQRSCFNDEAFMSRFIPIAVAIGVILVIRLIFDLVTSKERRHYFPRLTIGFGVLALSYMLAGIGSSYYEFKSTLFGLLEIVALCITYFYLIYSINWKEFKVDYIFFAMIVFGFVLLAQIIGSYIMNADLSIAKTRMVVITGWGVHTNVGGMAAILVCAPFYFIIKNKFVVLNSIISVLLLLSVYLSQARGPIAISTLLYLICLVISLIKVKPAAKIKTAIFVTLTIGIIAGLCLIFNNHIKDHFGGLFDSFFNNENTKDFFNRRFDTYKDGLHKFSEYPIIGTGWYSCKGDLFTFVFIPSRWHNTIIQLLATGGAFMTLAYLFHRFETILLLFKDNKKISISRFFVYIPILGLILSSMVDCYMFNLGPGLIYGILLAVMEKINPENKATL